MALPSSKKTKQNKTRTKKTQELQKNICFTANLTVCLQMQTFQNFAVSFGFNFCSICSDSVINCLFKWHLDKKENTEIKKDLKKIFCQIKDENLV